MSARKAGTPLVRVLVSNGHRASAGHGPGTFELPADEADRTVQARHGRVLGPAGSEGDPAAARQARGVSN